MAVLCLAHDNAEIEESAGEITSEQILLSINSIRLTKEAIRVTGSGNAHIMSVTASLMQARRSAYAVYTIRMEEVKWFQRLPPARGGTTKKKILYLENLSLLISSQDQRQVDQRFF